MGVPCNPAIALVREDQLLPVILLRTNQIFDILSFPAEATAKRNRRHCTISYPEKLIFSFWFPRQELTETLKSRTLLDARRQKKLNSSHSLGSAIFRNGQQLAFKCKLKKK